METKQLTQEDLKSLEAIFAYARKHISDHEQELIAVINFKQQLLEKLNSILKEQEAKKEENGTTTR